jgi:hypothetical protein
VRHSFSTRPGLRWASAALAPLVIGRPSIMATLAATVGISVLMLVLVVAVVALGAAFGPSAERRQACLQTLQTLLPLTAWTDSRNGRTTGNGSNVADIEMKSSSPRRIIGPP